VSYQLTFTQYPAYLHAAVTGQNTRENVARYMEEVIHECIARNCLRVLIEENLTGPRLGTSEIFSLVSAGSLRFMGTLRSMAYVDVNAHDDSMHFAESVALNRSFPVRVFGSVAAAQKWLLIEHERAAVSAPGGSGS
jgi:hypothetical protein